MSERILYGFFLVSIILSWSCYLSAKGQPLPPLVPFLYRASVTVTDRYRSFLHRNFYDTFDNLKNSCIYRSKTGL